MIEQCANCGCEGRLILWNGVGLCEDCADGEAIKEANDEEAIDDPTAPQAGPKGSTGHTTGARC
jgi:hypothetical protein